LPDNELAFEQYITQFRIYTEDVIEPDEVDHVVKILQQLGQIKSLAKETAYIAERSRKLHLGAQLAVDDYLKVKLVKLEELKAKKHLIEEVAAKHGIDNVRVFGSVGRGEEHADSDIDLLLRVSEKYSLLNLIAFEMEIEELLDAKVDVVPENGLSPYLKDNILAEATPL
jgi:uncharacterized protein